MPTYRPTRDPTEQRLQAFEQRYGRPATNLAAHAAFPLTLTTDVVYCLRETFLPDCPWYAVGDVLLSGLCTPAGHDMYDMEAATRRYLLRYLRDQFGEDRILELERFMVAYLRRRLLRQEPDHRALLLGEKPQWTSLACLRPSEARDEIRQALEQLALQTTSRSEQFRLASLVESYGDFLADRGFKPMLIDWADRVAEGDPIDDRADLAAQLKESGFKVSWVEFEVATVAFGAAEAEAPATDLLPFEAKTVTVNDRGDWVGQQTHQAFYFEEPLAEDVPPLRLMAIPSGEFMMGSTKDDDPGHDDSESPQHLVKISPFFMSQHPVTQAQWRAVAALPRQARDLKPAPSNFKGADLPVEQVSWYEAVEFCARLSAETGRTYRLPTEAEWEYACRADTTTPFHFGDTLTTNLANYNGSVFRNEPKGTRRGKTTPVEEFAFSNTFGLYNLHGNVWEWCLDYWHSNYEGAPTDGSAWLTDNEEASRVIRGGAWVNDPRSCRSACRYNYAPGDHNNLIGFRVVCEAPGL